MKSKISYNFIHFLGFRSNVRDYFSASDIGFLPSRFKGESAPLVLIDCLIAGKPVLASDVGEIRCMIDSSEGLAGELFALSDWAVDIEALGRLIVAVANDPFVYRKLLHCVPFAVAKFEISTMVDKYEKVYSDTLAEAKMR